MQGSGFSVQDLGSKNQGLRPRISDLEIGAQITVVSTIGACKEGGGGSHGGVGLGESVSRVSKRVPSKALVFGDLGGRVAGEQRSARLTEKDDACASRDWSASRRLDISPSPSDHIPTAVRPLSESWARA